jgi:hypothetical protein
MSISWHDIILDSSNSKSAWQDIFGALQELAQTTTSPVALHDQTVVPDRLLSEAAWQLWHEYPIEAVRTSEELKQWCSATSSTGKAVLILDALSLRELPSLIAGAKSHGIDPASIRITGSECPSTTSQFAHALGLSSHDSSPGLVQRSYDRVQLLHEFVHVVLAQAAVLQGHVPVGLEARAPCYLVA